VRCLQLRKQLADLQASSAAAAAAAAKAVAALQAQLTQAHEEAATLRRRITELEGKAKAATEAHSAAATQLAEATRLHAPCGQRIAALEGKAAQDAAEVRREAPFRRRSRLVALMFWIADLTRRFTRAFFLISCADCRLEEEARRRRGGAQGFADRDRRVDQGAFSLRALRALRAPWCGVASSFRS
jgi:hypothetical protein